MSKLVHVTTVPQSLGFFQGQAGYLKDRGFTILAISSPGDFLNRFRRSEAVKVYTVAMTRSIAPFDDLRALWQLYQLFRKIRPDIVHSHTPKAGFLGTLAARAAGVPSVFLSVFGLPQMTRTGITAQLLNLTTRLACSLAHRVWCDSFSMRDYVIEQGLCPATKAFVLGNGSVNGVDAEGVFSPRNYGPDVRATMRKQYGIPVDAPVMGYVGRIVRDKGMHELAGAWRMLRDLHPHLHLLIVGSFEPQDPLLPDDAALFHTDPRIHLGGQRKDVAAQYSAMDIFVMPSHREGFGITNIEAAAMELPVVSTRIPGCMDSAQDGVTGTLVQPRDAQALAEAVQIYLDGPALRRRHGRAGRERVLRDFRQDTIWEALYREYMHMMREKGIHATGARKAQ